MKYFYSIRSLFVNLIGNHIADPNNRAVSQTETKIFDILDDIIIITNKEGVIHYISPSSSELYGPQYKKLIGSSINSISESLSKSITESKYGNNDKDIHLEDYKGNLKRFEVKCTKDHKAFNRSILLLKKVEDSQLHPTQLWSQKEITELVKLLPGTFFKLVYKDNSFKFLYLTPNIKDLIGSTATEIINDSHLFFKSVHPKDLHTLKSHFQKSSEDFLPFSALVSFVAGHNTIKSVEIKAFPVQKDYGTIWNATIVPHIVEEDRNKLYKNALDNISEGVTITTARDDFPIVYVNDEFLRETGYSRHEVMGQNPRFLQGVKTNQEVVDIVREAIQNNKSFRGEILNYRKDGSHFHNLMTINPITDTNDEVTHFVGLQSNISHRIEIEEALKESNERFNLVVKATNDVIWDWDFLKNEISWYPSSEKIFGFMSQKIDVDPKWMFEHIHPKDRTRVHKNFYNTLKVKGSFWHDEYEFKNGEGNYLYISDKAYILYDNKDNPMRMIGAKQDLTKHKILLDAQINLTNELSHRNKDLQQFSYIVSHNLRSSIARIKGLTSLLNYPEHQLQEQTQIIINHISNMATDLDETLLDLSDILKVRSEFKEFKDKIEPAKLLEKIKIILQDQIDFSGAEISVNFKEAPSIITLKSYFFSILLNLVSNAIKYRDPTRKLKIEIATYRNDFFTILEVKDNGMGINLEMQKDKVFGLYKRFHPHIEGKGLGLYLVKTQAETMGGKVEVESKVNEGTTFKVFFKE